MDLMKKDSIAYFQKYLLAYATEIEIAFTNYGRVYYN
jgi:hypothetical protein